MNLVYDNFVYLPPSFFLPMINAAKTMIIYTRTEKSVLGFREHFKISVVHTLLPSLPTQHVAQSSVSVVLQRSAATKESTKLNNISILFSLATIL